MPAPCRCCRILSGPVKYENAFSSRQQPMATDKLLLGAYTIEIYRMENSRNEEARETGDPRENPPTSRIVRHDSEPTGDRTLFALVGREQPNRSATVGPLSHEGHYMTAFIERRCFFPALSVSSFSVRRRAELKKRNLRCSYVQNERAGDSVRCRKFVEHGLPALDEVSCAFVFDFHGIYHLACHRGLQEGDEYEEAQECKWGETGNPRENPPTNGIVRHDSHVRKSGSDPEGNRTRFTYVEGEYVFHGPLPAFAGSYFGNHWGKMSNIIQDVRIGSRTSDTR
ncbi:hypothetical protein PR048_031685 [Dryococelus australis]|uniref:Uncharacterized protein n=1 Tax=Dryococelus australis TaxID=614101 RepID=A0ABQ9G5Z6_9NEOP|nr:hypothetical protein PR048_031685 [Dryococelus australis]